MVALANEKRFKRYIRMINTKRSEQVLLDVAASQIAHGSQHAALAHELLAERQHGNAVAEQERAQWSNEAVHYIGLIHSSIINQIL